MSFRRKRLWRNNFRKKASSRSGNDNDPFMDYTNFVNSGLFYIYFLGGIMEVSENWVSVSSPFFFDNYGDYYYE